jgi:hypothetical protein
MDAGSFRRAAVVAVLAGLLLASGGCATKARYVVNQGLDPANPSGVVTNTFLNFPPPGLQRAYIYEIDGKHVPHTRRSFRLPAGEHTIRVWPIDTAPRALQIVPDLARIRRERIEVESITIDVKPGHRYFLAARTNVVSAKSTIPGADIHQFPDQKFVIPVVSDTAEPVDLEEASIGVALFLLPLVVAPMVVPALF